MVGKVFALIISLTALWFIVMFFIFKEHHRKESEKELEQISNKYARSFRKVWFLILRLTKSFRTFMTKIIAKGFFYVFPKAKTVFETKDELAGLEHGPSSYFLMSISENKDKINAPDGGKKKARRKTKNV